MTLLLPVICLFACFLNLLFEYKNSNSLAAKSKLLAGLTLLAFAWDIGAKESLYGQLILSGLLASLVGDVLLSMKKDGHHFLLGILAFLVTHILYSIAFSIFETDRVLLPWVIGIILLFIVGVFVWLRNALIGYFKLAVPLYLAAIGVMLILAWTQQTPYAWIWIVSGSSLFAISDMFVARNRLIKTTVVNRMVGLPMYYIAQLMLAYSTVLV